MVRRLGENWVGKYAFPPVIWSLTDRRVVVVRTVPCPKTGRIRLRLQVDVFEIFAVALAVVEDIPLINRRELLESPQCSRKAYLA